MRNKKIQGSGTRKILEGDDVQKEETVRISSYDYRSWDKFDVVCCHAYVSVNCVKLCNELLYFVAVDFLVI